MKNRKPLVSVIMPVYNAGEFLRQTLNSVFDQTYQNIEVIAIDDGSTDNSLKILKEYAKRDSRLKVLGNVKNLGVGQSANKALKKAKGNYIARLDADDLIPLDRIEKQVKFLMENSDIVVVGGQVELITEDGLPIVVKHFPETHSQIINFAFTAMPLQQGAMMVNKKLLPKDFIWYKEKLKTSEDLDFFFRAFKYGRGANLPEVVLYYRQHGKSITQVASAKKIFFHAYKIRKKALRYYSFQVSDATMFLMIAQYILVKLLPSSMVYPLYYLWRGLRSFRMPKYGYFPLLQHITNYLF